MVGKSTQIRPNFTCQLAASCRQANSAWKTPGTAGVTSSSIMGDLKGIRLTPPKFNMEPENDGLEDVFPLQLGDSQVPC